MLKNLVAYLFFIAAMEGYVFAQPSSTERAFIQAQLRGDTSLVRFLDPAGRELSQRLGIAYEHVPNKCLVGDEIDSAIVRAVNAESTSYTLEDSSLGNGFTRLRFLVNDPTYRKDYFFKDGQLILAPLWSMNGWRQKKSRYFIVHASDTSTIGSYALGELDRFAETLMTLLDYSDAERSLLEREKIHYAFCRNSEEITAVAGVDTRGIYLLSTDIVASTYPCHYHEIAHLLMNFKLHRLSLFTHPFMQEGFAVAVGGRGGLDRRAIFPMAVYLARSGGADYAQFTLRSEFQANDPSLTYPVCGLYNLFLLRTWGAQRYLSFYRNSPSGENDALQIDTSAFPARTIWNAFLDSIAGALPVGLDDSRSSTWKSVYVSDSCLIDSNDSLYRFRLNRPFRIFERQLSFASGFQPPEPAGTAYVGEKYLVTADSAEARFYNRWTGTLLGAYIAAFALPPVPVLRLSGLYQFVVRKTLLDEQMVLTK